MTAIDLPSSILPKPAQPTGEQTVRQQQYTNGATPNMSGSIFPGQIVISSKVAFTVVGIIASAIIGGGWLLGPAKDRDLQDTRKEVAAIAVAVGRIADKVDKMAEQVQSVQVDVARMQGSPAPAAPSYRAKAVKQPRPKVKVEKPATVFGGF